MFPRMSSMSLLLFPLLSRLVSRRLSSTVLLRFELHSGHLPGSDVSVGAESTHPGTHTRIRASLPACSDLGS